MNTTLYYTRLQHTISQNIQYINRDIQQFEVLLIQSNIDNVFNIKNDIKNIISAGHPFITMINGYLEMIIIKEENQSNKFIIEECIQTSYSSDRFINIFLDLIKLINNNEIKKLCELANIKKKSPDLIDIFNQTIDACQDDFNNEIIIRFNSYLNEYRFIITKIKEILKKIRN
jgi:hypothetical protein